MKTNWPIFLIILVVILCFVLVMGFKVFSFGERRVTIARDLTLRAGTEVEFSLGQDARAWAIHVEEFRPAQPATLPSSVEVSIWNHGAAFDLLLREVSANKVTSVTLAPKDHIVVFRGPLSEFLAVMLKSSRLKPIGNGLYEEWNPFIMIRSINEQKISAKLSFGSTDNTAKGVSVSIYAFIPKDTL